MACVGEPVAQPNNTTTCDYNGETYNPGDTYMDIDDCNACTCNENGLTTCTLMICDVVSPENNPETPEEIFCTQDVKDCGGDVWVGRDPANDCEFFPCDVALQGATTLPANDGSIAPFQAGEPTTLSEEGEPATLPEVEPACIINGIGLESNDTFVASDGCNVRSCYKKSTMVYVMPYECG